MYPFFYGYQWFDSILRDSNFCLQFFLKTSLVDFTSKLFWWTHKQSVPNLQKLFDTKYLQVFGWRFVHSILSKFISLHISFTWIVWHLSQNLQYPVWMNMQTFDSILNFYHQSLLTPHPQSPSTSPTWSPSRLQFISISICLWSLRHLVPKTASVSIIYVS